VTGPMEFELPYPDVELPAGDAPLILVAPSTAKDPECRLVRVALEALAGAFARPMMHALAVGGRELDVMRIVARASVDPPQGWDRFDASFDRIRADVLRVLKANVPGVRDRELIFRTRCAAGLLNWLVLAPVSAELRNKSEKQIGRRLVPVLAGTFRGISTA